MNFIDIKSDFFYAIDYFNNDNQLDWYLVNLIDLYQ